MSHAEMCSCSSRAQSREGGRDIINLHCRPALAKRNCLCSLFRNAGGTTSRERQSLLHARLTETWRCGVEKLRGTTDVEGDDQGKDAGMPRTRVGAICCCERER